MSFWKGLSRAMESNEAQRNVEQQREDRLASEAKAEAFRDKQYSNQLSQQAKTNSRADKAFDRDEDRYQTNQGRLDKADDAAAASAKAASAKDTRDHLFKIEGRKYDQSRDVVADVKVARQEHAAAAQLVFENELKTLSRKDAEANLLLAQKRFENTVKQQGVTNAQWDESQKFKVDVQADSEERADKEFKYKVGVTTAAQTAAAVAAEAAAAKVIYEKTRDEIGDAKAKAVMDQRLVEYGNTLKQQGLSQENWEKAFVRQGEQQGLDKEQRAFDNKIKMITVGADLTKALGGNGGTAKGSKAPAVKDMEAAGMVIRDQLGGKQGIDNLPKGKKEFFETILADPAAAYGITAFLKAQREEGNDINIMNVPDYISIAGIIKAEGNPQAADELRNMILEGDGDITQLGKLVDGIEGLKAYSPMKTVFSQTKAVKDFPGQEKDFDTFKSVLLKKGIAAYNRLPAAERVNSPLHTPLLNMENTNETTQGRGFDSLFNVMGADLAEEMGMKDNVMLKPYFAVIAADRKVLNESRSQNPVGTMTPGLGEESSGMSGSAQDGPTNMSSTSVPSYTEAEFEEFFAANPDFTGSVRVDGELLSNTADPIPEGLGKIATDAAPEVPAEVKEAVESIIATGDQAAIEEAASEIAAEYGEGMAADLFDDEKAARGTGQSAMMDGLQTPFSASEPKEEGYIPPTMGATEPNTPAVREAVANVPAQVTEAIESVVAQGDPAAIEQAKKEIADEFGEAVAAILFDNVKSARGTGKSAVMDGLQ